jgi:primosomal protein N' (replication factor Y)
MDKVKSISQDIINELEKVIEKQQVELLGPVTPIISKLRGNYRLQIILKVYQHDTNFLLPIVEKFDKDIKVYFNPPTTIL